MLTYSTSLLRALQLRLQRLSAENVRIAKHGLLIFSFALIAKAAGAFKEVAIAWRYGVSETVDAYVFVFNLLAFPVAVWYGVLAFVYIPIVKGKARQDSAEVKTFQRELSYVTAVIGIVGTIACCVLLLLLFDSPLSGLSDEAQRSAREIVPYLSLIVVFGIVAHYGSVAMMADGRHTNTVLEGVPALVILATVLVVPSASIQPLMWGTVIGAFVHAFAALWAARESAFLLPRFSTRSKLWASFWAGMGVMVVAQVLQGMGSIVDQFFASHVEPGAVAILGYVNRVIALVITLGALALSRAALPVFSGMSVGAVKSSAVKWSRVMLALGIVISVLGWTLSERIVRLLFERGAFSRENSREVADVLSYAFLQVPFYFAGLVLIYGLLSHSRCHSVLTVSAVALATKISASAVLVPPLGLQGLMLATALMYFVTLVIFRVLLRRG